jgi:hypothetical protein
MSKLSSTEVVPVESSVDIARRLDALVKARRDGVLTDDEYEAKRVPLVNALHEVAAQELGPLGSVTLGTTVVVAGELIESAWGNQVRTDLLALRSGTVHLTGETSQSVAGDIVVGGFLNVGNLPTNSNDGASVRNDGAIHSVVVVGGAAPGSLPNITMGRTTNPAQDVGGVYARFDRTSAGTTIGSITIASASAVAYNTTSDPRTKQPVRDASDTAALVQHIGGQAYWGRSLEDGNPVGDEWVFVDSTAVEEVAPYAVTGERDAVDDDGNIEPQQVNFPGLVPMLFAALANALDRLDAAGL